MKSKLLFILLSVGVVGCTFPWGRPAEFGLKHLANEIAPPKDWSCLDRVVSNTPGIYRHTYSQSYSRLYSDKNILYEESTNYTVYYNIKGTNGSIHFKVYPSGMIEYRAEETNFNSFPSSEVLQERRNLLENFENKFRSECGIRFLGNKITELLCNNNCREG